MALTLSTQELFDRYDTLDSGNVGAFTTVLNYANMRPLGPRDPAMQSLGDTLGWSACMALRGNGTAPVFRWAGRPNRSVYTFWVRAQRVNTDNVNRVRMFLAVANDNTYGIGGQNYISLDMAKSDVDTNTQWKLDIRTSGRDAAQDSGSLTHELQLNRWYCFGFESFTHPSAGAHGRVKVWAACPEIGMAWQQLWRNNQIYTNIYRSIQIGISATGASVSSNNWRGRLGKVQHFTAGSEGDIALFDPTAEAPIVNRTHYYITPGHPNADDDGPGISPDAPWATPTRFLTANEDGEILRSPHQYWNFVDSQPVSLSSDPDFAEQYAFAHGVFWGWVGADPASGSTINIDSRLEPMRGHLRLRDFGDDHRGVVLTDPSYGTADCKGWTNAFVYTPTWTRHDAATYPNVWRSTHGQGALSMRLWQIDGAATKATGVSMTSAYATAMSTLNANPGRYHYDNTYLYVSTSDGQAPDIAGRSWEMTLAEGDSSNLVAVTGGNLLLERAWLHKSGGLSVLGGTVGGYCFAYTGTAVGRDLLMERYCKHCIGTGDGDKSVCVIARSRMGGDPAFSANGGATAWVVFRAGNASGGGAWFLGVDQFGGREIAGSPLYTDEGAGPITFYGHSGSNDGWIDYVVLIGCRVLGRIQINGDLPIDERLLILSSEINGTVSANAAAITNTTIPQADRFNMPPIAWASAAIDDGVLSSFPLIRSRNSINPNPSSELLNMLLTLPLGTDGYSSSTFVVDDGRSVESTFHLDLDSGSVRASLERRETPGVGSYSEYPGVFLTATDAINATLLPGEYRLATANSATPVGSVNLLRRQAAIAPRTYNALSNLALRASNGSIEVELVPNPVSIGAGVRALASVASATTPSPPASPSVGATYIIPPDASGEWEGLGGRIAHRTLAGWAYDTPPTGAWVVAADDGLLRSYVGAGVWVVTV